MRATEEEKIQQIHTVEALQKREETERRKWLQELRQSAIENRNLFDSLMNASKYCSLVQLTNALFDVGGMYRRNM